jgi:glycosyltransferase involved in cell wall biosynthesis
VGPGHVASNPRLVKEADALASAGFRVRVVAADYMAAIRPLDEAVLARARWDVERVSLGEGFGRRWRALRRKACAFVTGRGWSRSVRAALWAENDLVGRLAAAAAARPADLFIGHYLPGLAAAGHAAGLYHAALGFDAEDSHVDELPDTAEFRGRRAARERIEAAYLPRCRHLTAASPLIADALRHRYRVEPEVVLNVFHLREGPPGPLTTVFQRGEGPPTLYWFSQTIGPGRGIEAILHALARTRQPAHLHLRGLPAKGYPEELEDLAGRLGLAGRLHLHGPAEPGRMAPLAAPFDLGLAVELNEPPNRALCLTNKVFTYLLAGVPTLMSRTPAQDQLAPDLGPAALLVDLADTDGIARVLDGYFGDAERQRQARAEAWRLGRERYNWDVEQRVFLASVRRALELTAKPAGLRA